MKMKKLLTTGCVMVVILSVFTLIASAYSVTATLTANSTGIISGVGPVPSGYVYWCFVIQTSVFDGEEYLLTFDKTPISQISDLVITEIIGAYVVGNATPFMHYYDVGGAYAYIGNGNAMSSMRLIYIFAYSVII